MLQLAEGLSAFLVLIHSTKETTVLIPIFQGCDKISHHRALWVFSQPPAQMSAPPHPPASMSIALFRFILEVRERFCTQKQTSFQV